MSQRSVFPQPLAPGQATVDVGGHASGQIHLDRKLPHIFKRKRLQPPDRGAARSGFHVQQIKILFFPVFRGFQLRDPVDRRIQRIIRFFGGFGIDIGQLKLRNAPAGIAQGVVLVITVKQDRTESVLRSNVCEERCNQSLADPSFCSSDHHKFRHTFKPSISPAARRPSVRLRRSAGPPRQRRGGRFPSSGCTPGSLWRPSS